MTIEKKFENTDYDLEFDAILDKFEDHIRTYSGDWFSGASKVDPLDTILNTNLMLTTYVAVYDVIQIIRNVNDLSQKKQKIARKIIKELIASNDTFLVEYDQYDTELPIFEKLATYLNNQPITKVVFEAFVNRDFQKLNVLVRFRNSFDEFRQNLTDMLLQYRTEKDVASKYNSEIRDAENRMKSDIMKTFIAPTMLDSSSYGNKYKELVFDPIILDVIAVW